MKCYYTTTFRNKNNLYRLSLNEYEWTSRETMCRVLFLYFQLYSEWSFQVFLNHFSQIAFVLVLLMLFKKWFPNVELGTMFLCINHSQFQDRWQSYRQQVSFTRNGRVMCLSRDVEPVERMSAKMSDPAVFLSTELQTKIQYELYISSAIVMSLEICFHNLLRHLSFIPNICRNYWTRI